MMFFRKRLRKRRSGARSRRLRAPERAHYLAHKESARALATERVTYWNTHYGFLYNTIAIRNQQSRWGSCSIKRNLNFNYRILFLPPELVDYIVVHELCHLQEFNHASAFWQLVARTIPDYREHKAILAGIRFNM